MLPPMNNGISKLYLLQYSDKQLERIIILLAHPRTTSLVLKPQGIRNRFFVFIVEYGSRTRC